MGLPALNVELTLRADHADDGKPFSETVNRSFNMTRAEYHELQRGLAGLLLGFGDRAVESHAAKHTPAKSPGKSRAAKTS